MSDENKHFTPLGFFLNLMAVTRRVSHRSAVQRHSHAAHENESKKYKLSSHSILL
jgi:hypothetical protein